MAEGGNGVARWGAWASAVGTAAVILGAMFVLYSQVSTAYARRRADDGTAQLVSRSVCMIGLLIGLIVLCVIVAILWWILQQIPIPPQFRWIVYVVFGLVILLVVLNYLPGDLLPHGRF
jgi:hypothetical protein